MSMFIKDNVHVSDAGTISVGGQTARSWGDEKSVVEVEGWVKLVLRERGKIVPGSHREGHNIWTNTGREFLAQRISIDLANPSGTLRTDAVAYIGVGTGSRLEEPGVDRLNNAVQYDQDLFLADITAVEFPVYPIRTTVQYKRTFGETEISLVGTVQLSELGLFTNGDPLSVPPNAFGTRQRGFAESFDAAPVAYKTFEPVGKTTAMQLEVAWQIRF
jgi:hypothetical protein